MDNLILRRDKNPIDYQECVKKMQKDLLFIKSNPKKIILWFTEHNPVYTMGSAISNSQHEDVLDSNIELVQANRGGKITYHGPGQKMIYPIIDIKNYFATDLRKYVHFLEDMTIYGLKKIGIQSRKHMENHGVFIDNNKIGFVGVRISRGIAHHGIAINFTTDLQAYNKIRSCGLNVPITSVQNLMKNYHDDLLIEFENACVEFFHQYTRSII